MSDAFDFLAARRSVPHRMLRAPVPDRAELERILTVALRVPDHGKLEPWRLVVIGPAAMPRLADLAEARARATGGDDKRIAKGRGQYDTGRLAVAVISTPVTHPRIPEIEQILSAGALCMALVTAATAAGWGACWLTGWPAHDPDFAAQAFGCTPSERVAGLIHIGSRPEAPLPPDRPRPDPAARVRWLDA